MVTLDVVVEWMSMSDALLRRPLVTCFSSCFHIALLWYHTTLVARLEIGNDSWRVTDSGPKAKEAKGLFEIYLNLRLLNFETEFALLVSRCLILNFSRVIKVLHPLTSSPVRKSGSNGIKKTKLFQLAREDDVGDMRIKRTLFSKITSSLAATHTHFPFFATIFFRRLNKGGSLRRNVSFFWAVCPKLISLQATREKLN